MPQASKNSVYRNGFQTRALLSAIAFSVIVVAYQNCGRVQSTPVETSNRKITHTTDLSSVQNFDLIEQEVLKRDASYDPRTNTVVINGQTLQLNGDLVQWKVNLTNKTLVKTYYGVPANDPLANIVTCSIDQSWIDTLYGLLAATEVCQFEITPQPDQCAQVIEAEKHSFYTISDTTFDLGFRSTPCASYHDVCVNQRELYLTTLKDFILAHQNCSN